MLLCSIWSGGCIIYQSLNKNLRLTSALQLPLFPGLAQQLPLFPGLAQQLASFPGLPTVHAVSMMCRIAIKKCTVREQGNLPYLLLRWSNRDEFLGVGKGGGESAASYHRRLVSWLRILSLILFHHCVLPLTCSFVFLFPQNAKPLSEVKLKNLQIFFPGLSKWFMFCDELVCLC